MSHLDSHLEQISLSAKTIGELDFPTPKMFTNALLATHEITTLIRDTEPHERALFSVDASVTQGIGTGSSRRTTTFNTDGSNRRKTFLGGPQRQSSAVAKVLGGDMLRRIQQSSRGQGRRGVDVQVLLQGAEKLCSVYTVNGASEKILSLRNRYHDISKSIAEYEGKVVKQQTRLNSLSSTTAFDHMSDDEEVANTATASVPLTEEDLRREEEEIKELELRKKELEERVAGIEQDLGGLLR